MRMPVCEWQNKHFIKRMLWCSSGVKSKPLQMPSSTVKCCHWGHEFILWIAKEAGRSYFRYFLFTSFVLYTLIEYSYCSSGCLVLFSVYWSNWILFAIICKKKVLQWCYLDLLYYIVIYVTEGIWQELWTSEEAPVWNEVQREKIVAYIMEWNETGSDWIAEQ